MSECVCVCVCVCERERERGRERRRGLRERVCVFSVAARRVDTRHSKLSSHPTQLFFLSLPTINNNKDHPSSMFRRGQSSSSGSSGSAGSMKALNQLFDKYKVGVLCCAVLCACVCVCVHVHVRVVCCVVVPFPAPPTFSLFEIVVVASCLC